MVGPLCQSQSVEIFHRHLMTLAATHSLIEQRQLHVLHRRLKGDEVERLEDEAYHLVAILSGSSLTEILDQHVVEKILTGVIVVENAQYI